MLSEVKSDREGEIPHDIPYMQTLKRNGTNEFMVAWAVGIFREFRIKFTHSCILNG